MSEFWRIISIMKLWLEIDPQTIITLIHYIRKERLTS